MVVFFHHALRERNGVGREQPPPSSWDYAYDEPPHVLPAPLRRALAWATCPAGHTCTVVASVHTVGPDGSLSPSYVCPVPGCTFHDHVLLAGWQGER